MNVVVGQRSRPEHQETQCPPYPRIEEDKAADELLDHVEQRVVQVRWLSALGAESLAGKICTAVRASSVAPLLPGFRLVDGGGDKARGCGGAKGFNFLAHCSALPSRSGPPPFFRPPSCTAATSTKE